MVDTQSNTLGGEALSSDRPNTSALVASTVAINLLSLGLPILTLQVYDRILPNPESSTLSVLIIGVAVAIALEAGLRLARAYTIEWAGAVTEHRLSCAAIDHLLRADLSRVGPHGVGEQLHRLGAIGKLKDFHNGQSVTVMLELGFILIFLALITYIAGWLVVVPLAVVGLLVACGFVHGRTLRGALSARDAKDDARYNFLIESLERVHTLKAFALERAFQRRYERFAEGSARANFMTTEAAAKTFNTGAVFANLMVIAVVAVGASIVLAGEMTSGALIATVLLSGRVVQPVQRALALWARYQDYRNARSRVGMLFETPVTATAMVRSDVSKLGSVELRNVSFRYGNDAKWVLEKVDLSLAPGDIVAVSGAQGSGKSTLVSLLANIVPPTIGEALVNDVPVQEIGDKFIGDHVGYLMTEGVIFRGTIRENITRFGTVDEKGAREVASLLQVDKDVARLPAGFETRLEGSAVDTIAPGLRQRIAFTRALATKPRILLFDQADRALDRAGYNLVFSLLNRLRGKVTMVPISDDQNITALADRHYVIENARLRKVTRPVRSGVARRYQELDL